ncbi:MAG: chorismate-binding protein, partial [Planctomycetota bacterium]
GTGPQRVVTRRKNDDADGDPLDALREALGNADYVRDPALPGFTGGLVGYAAFDLVRYFEPEKLGGPTGGPHDDRGLPDLVFGLYDACIVFDNVERTAKVVGHAWIEPGDDIDQAYDDAMKRVDELTANLTDRPLPAPADEIDPSGATRPDYTANLSQDEYEAAVAKGVEYIKAGDIFQFVPSMRLRVASPAKPFDVYRALRVVNPSPFMVYVKSPHCTLIGNSPEILCRVRDGAVQTRPLAGTRKRGTTAEEDEALSEDLLADDKERSEHVMLVDLHRNDIGRVAETGSVVIDDLMNVERYSHVMHIVTDVSARLAEGCDAIDALRVSLPVGTVSGAPKIRAIQIIDELEPTRRGPYGGAVGHIDYSGDMDTCIALRTIVWRDGVFDVQAGAGVVADSVPRKEYDECFHKAAAMLNAVAIAEGGFATKSNDAES